MVIVTIAINIINMVVVVTAIHVPGGEVTMDVDLLGVTARPIFLHHGMQQGTPTACTTSCPAMHRGYVDCMQSHPATTAAAAHRTEALPPIQHRHGGEGATTIILCPLVMHSPPNHW
jgi:hypothetical protein